MDTKQGTQPRNSIKNSISHSFSYISFTLHQEDMSSRCRSSRALDARSPVRASYINLYRWPESDIDFVKTVAGEDRVHTINSKRKWVPGSPSVDSYLCRQMYLRSYVFNTKKETLAKRTTRHLSRVKTRVAHLSLLKEKMQDVRSQFHDLEIKKKGCGVVMVRKMKSLVGHLLSCTNGGPQSD